MVDDDEAPRLDTRVLSKIPLLQGRDTAEFRSWQFVLKASLGLLDTAYSTELPLVEALRSAMPQPDSAETRARSEKMYYILALTTADHAQVIVQQVESGHGYEAYRRLVEAYDPATSMRGLSMLEGYLDGQVHVKELFGTAAGLEVARHAVRAKDGPRSG